MSRTTDPFVPVKAEKPIPYDFVLDALAKVQPTTRAMFGSVAVYADERVLFILRRKGDPDDGVWLAFEPEHEAELQRQLPRMVRIERLPNVRSWRKLSALDTSFEDDVLRACRLVTSGSTLIGRVPDRQRKKKSTSPRASRVDSKAATRKKQAKTAATAQTKASPRKPARR